MISFLSNLIEGMRQVLVLYPDRTYIRPKRGDFQKDYDNLRSDAGRVARDLREGVAKYGEADYRTSS